MTPETYLERVRDLLPAVRERAADAEKLRRLPEETFADFQQAGLFRALQPKRYGGYELDPGVFYRAVCEVAAACGSTGWVLGVLGVHNWHLGIMDPRAQQDVWGEDDSVQLSTSLALTGTGSKDIVVTDAFVPDYRTHSYRDAFALNHPGCAVNTAPLYRLPFGLVFTYGIVSPAIGAAQGALAAFREQALRRVNVRDGSRTVEDPFIQFRLAEAAAEIDAARERMLTIFAEMMRCARAGEEIPLAARARYRWDSGKAIARSVRAVDLLFEAAGGHALFLDNPIQRAWRDVHAMRAHAGNNPERASFIFGRSEFGLPPQDIRF